MTLKIIFFLLLCILSGADAVNAAEDVSAQSAIVIEQSSGRVLYQKNAETKLPMASTTKIMTAICALENGELNDEIEISAEASAVEGSSMYLETGERMTLDELLYGLLLSSGNDAAAAIAEHFGGTETFAGMMNEKACEVGAESTNFTNPSGLPDDEHYSTAHDMARITAYGLHNPNFAKIVGTKSYKISGDGKAYPRNLTNHNKLLNMCEGCIGVKTGFTKSAGRCLVSACRRNDMTLICVTLNAPNDWNDHCVLYDGMFSRYRLSKIVHEGQILGEAEVENSETASLPGTAAEDLYYPLAKDEQCIISVFMSPPLEAPVTEGCECGNAAVSFNGEEIGTVKLVTAEGAEKINALKELRKNLKESLGSIYWEWLTFLHI